MPCRGICARITGPNGSPLPYLQNSYVIRNGPGIYDYLLSRPDGSVVIGGARSTFYGDKRTWYDITNDDELIEPARNYFDGFMQKAFCGWENTGAVTERVWTGSTSPTHLLCCIFVHCFFFGFSFFSHGFLHPLGRGVDTINFPSCAMISETNFFFPSPREGSMPPSTSENSESRQILT